MELRARRPPSREVIVAGASGYPLRQTTQSHWPFAWHFHPELELTWIKRGHGLRFVGESVEPFAAGDLVLIGPGIPHTWTSQPQPGQECVAVVAQFPADPAGLGSVAHPAARVVRDLVARAQGGLVIEGADRTEVCARLDALLAVSDPLERLGLLLALLAVLARGTGRALSRAGPSVSDPRLADLLAFVHAHAGRTLPQPRVAARAGMTPAAFSRFFRRRLGTTFVDYLTTVRIGNACRLLAESRMPVTAVALEVGIANLSNFNRRFRQVRGMTPTAYRRLHRGVAG